MKTIIHQNKEFTEIPKGNGFYYICKDTSEILSTMRPNSPLILKPVINGNGYYMVGFFSKTQRINVNVHRAMMETFVTNPQNYPHINHIDGNKLNNMLSNLEWCTAKHNTQHAHDIGLATAEHCERKVHQYYLNGKYRTSFKSLHEAARQVNSYPGTILHCINGDTKTAASSLWSYDKLPSVTPYTGAPITDYYLLDGNKVSTLKELCNLTNFTRALIHRRLKAKGNKFIEKGYSIERVLCQ